MQLIKRLQCLALAAIALAFAQTALAATFPGTTTDETCTPSSEYAYYTDGTTTYKFTAWTNILKAVGWDVGTGSKVSGVGTPGGTAGDPLVVKIYNYTNYVSKLGCQIVDNGKGMKMACLSHGNYKFGYVTYEFHNCYFMREADQVNTPNCWGAYDSDYSGIKLKFFDCNIGDPENHSKSGGCPAFYCLNDTNYGQNKYPDFEFTRCNIRAFDQRVALRLFGGSNCGDLVVSNCVLDCYINAIIQGDQFNSVGEKPTMIVKDCKLDQRVNKTGWVIGSMNAGFARYEVSNFMDMDENPIPMMFFKSYTYEQNPQSVIEDHFDQGKILAANGTESEDDKAITSCVCTADQLSPNYTYFEFAVPARLVYDANGGTGTYPVASEEGYDYRDTADRYFTVMPPAESDFSKNGFAVEKWNMQANGSGKDYTSGTIPNGSQGQTNVVLYAIYGNTPKQTGWYTITGIHKNDIAAAKEDSLANIGNYIKTIKYPWYSGIHYITNVYDRVTATYAGGDLPTDDDAHPEVSWSNCGDIIDFGGGVKYTNQLQVKIFPKTGTTGEQLRIDTSDYIPDTPRAIHNLHLYYASKTDAKYAKFIFENCYMAHNTKVSDTNKNEIPIDWSGHMGVAFAMRNCTAECGFTGMKATTLTEHHSVDIEYSSVRFVPEGEKKDWSVSCNCWNGDFLMTNCVFESKIIVSVTPRYGDDFDAWGTDCYHDAFWGETDCIISNNVWLSVAPNFRLVTVRNAWNVHIGPNTYGPEGGEQKLIGMNVIDHVDLPGQVQWWTNETEVVFSSNEIPSDGHWANYYRVYYHTVKFVETDNESELDTASSTTYYILDGDVPQANNLWTELADKKFDDANRTDSAPDAKGHTWKNYNTGNEFDEEKSLSFAAPSFGDTVIYYWGEGKQQAEPEMVGTLKMSSFVKGHEPTTPSGLSWRVGENGTLYPLLVGSGESPSASECEYYIFSGPNETDVEKGAPATLENLKKLDATEKGTDYYIRGIVTDFSEEPEVKEHAPLVSAPAKFTVVNPEYSEYDDFMFVDWIESTDCQYLDTLVDPAQNGVTNFGFELDFKDDCFVPSSGNPCNDAPIIGSSTLELDDWSGFFFKNYSHVSEYDTYGLTEGQFRFCQMLQQWTASGYVYAFQQPLLTNDKRLQVSFRQLHYSISSSDDNTYGIDWDNLATFDEEKARKHFAGSVYLASAHISDPVEKPYDYKGVNHNMHFYGLRFYNGTELIYEGIPAIEKSTGHRGLLRVNGTAGGEDAFFRYSETYTNGLDIVTNTATKAEMYVANLGDKVKGPLGLNEFNAPLLDFGTHLAQDCGCFEVSAPSDKVAVTLEKQIEDRLWDYAVEETPGAQFIGTKGMTNATFTVLYATNNLLEDQYWTNTVVNANLTTPDGATLGNGSLQLFDDENWSAEPPEGAEEFKVVVLTAVSKPVVRTVTVTRGITVTLDANGGKYGDGEETATLVAMPGETMVELDSDKIPTRDGYTFIGYIDESGEQYYDKDGKPTKEKYPETDINLYAHWLVACPLELFIAAHAHTADDYVYLAVQPSFKPELTPTAFADWLNGAKEAFRVCASDDGETFDATPSEVILDDSGEHKYDADVANGWVWMKVNISAAKDADKKYWKAMFVTPAPESAD